MHIEREMEEPNIDELVRLLIISISKLINNFVFRSLVLKLMFPPHNFQIMIFIFFFFSLNTNI